MKYVGKTIRDIDKRNDEHSCKLESDCSGMINPLIKEIGKVYGSHKTILNYETMYIIEYRKLYGERLINKYNNKEDKKTFIAELPIKIMPVLPKLCECKDRYVLNFKGKDIFNRKFGKSKENAYEKMMVFINENYKDGEFLKMF